MSKKYFVMNINLGIPLEYLVSEKEFEEEYEGSPQALEAYFTDVNGMNHWLIEGDGGLKPVIQDVMIKELSDGLYGDEEL